MKRPLLDSLDVTYSQNTEFFAKLIEIQISWKDTSTLHLNDFILFTLREPSLVDY